MSRANKVGERKRKKRYDQKVWKGWRDSDGISYPVTMIKGRDLKK